MMTEKEAMSALGQHLKFGDPQQLRALEFMEKLNDALRAMAVCPAIRHHRTEWRRGRGWVHCRCTWEFNEELIEAATARLFGEL